VSQFYPHNNDSHQKVSQQLKFENNVSGQKKHMQKITSYKGGGYRKRANRLHTISV